MSKKHPTLPPKVRLISNRKGKRHPKGISLASPFKHLVAIPDTRHIPWLGRTGTTDR